MLFPWLSALKRSVRQCDTAPSSRSPATCLLQIEELESRLTPSVYLVNVLGDSFVSASGSGSGTHGDLRFCLDQALQDRRPDTITFDPRFSPAPRRRSSRSTGHWTRSPRASPIPTARRPSSSSALPDNITIDGSLGANVPRGSPSMGAGSFFRLFAVEGGGARCNSSQPLAHGRPGDGRGRWQ